jgi:hypothetical protein
LPFKCNLQRYTAEPIREKTVADFCGVFGMCSGLRPEAGLSAGSVQLTHSLKAPGGNP